MLTEDYIMRMINQAVAALMLALGLKKKGQYQDALQTLDQGVENLLGLNARLADQLDEGTLLDMLTFLGKLDVDRLLILADLKAEQSEIFSLLGRTDASKDSTQRSLRLYLEAARADLEIPGNELIHKIEQLRLKVTLSDLPLETRMALLDYFDRVLAADDDFLSAVGVSRQEIQAAISAID